MPQSWQLGAIEVGGYISIWKCVALLLMVMVWVRLMTWADKDAEAAHMPRLPLNMGLMAGFLGAVFLFFVLPGFLIAFAAMIGVLLIEVAAYLGIRHQKVGLSDLGKEFKKWIGSLGRGGKSKEASRGNVILLNKGGASINPPSGEDADRTGYDAIQDILEQPLLKGAERIDLLPGEVTATVKYWVDGVSYEQPPVPRSAASGAVKMLKDAMGMDMTDRRKPQQGTLKATLNGQKHELRILAAGSTAGESLIIDVDIKKRFDKPLGTLGFLPDQLETIESAIADNTGVVLCAMPRGQGLTTLLYGIARRHDAFLTHIHTIERAPDIELEGITQNSLPSTPAAGEETKMADWVTSQEPDVIIVTQLEEPKTATSLARFVREGKRVYVGMRAGNAFEAMDQWRKLVGDEKLAMNSLNFIVAGRTVRKLCDACKVDYTPDPDTMRKLNLSPDKIGKLFTARTQALRDNRGNEMVCQFCGDMRFIGRTGIYEILAIDDEIRQTVLAGGSINQLKMLFKKQKRRYIQEVGITRAVAGETSIQEIARAMKSSDSSSSPPNRPNSGSGGGGKPVTSGGGKPTGSSPSSSKPPPSKPSTRQS